jgi:hypothetical protein
MMVYCDNPPWKLLLSVISSCPYLNIFFAFWGNPLFEFGSSGSLAKIAHVIRSPIFSFSPLLSNFRQSGPNATMYPVISWPRIVGDFSFLTPS